jgi:carbamate kinase
MRCLGNERLASGHADDLATGELSMELDNVIDHQDTVAVVTRTEVAADDPAFAAPTKFIGPVYEEAEARRLAAEFGWTVRSDGEAWRRVVPSPEPVSIVQLPAIRRLIDGGWLVVCAGGGGVPVVRTAEGEHVGVEAVIDKDLATSLLASNLGADILVLATDVDAVYTAWGTPQQAALGHVSPAELRGGDFPAGSMGPKVEAVCRFVERGGARAAIGSLADIEGLVDGSAGTQISASGRRS